MSRLFWQVDPSIRSMMALQEERGSTSYSELQKEATQRDLTQATESQAPALTWSRLPGQVNDERNIQMCRSRKTSLLLV